MVKIKDSTNNQYNFNCIVLCGAVLKKCLGGVKAKLVNQTYYGAALTAGRMFIYSYFIVRHIRINLVLSKSGEK